MGSFPHLNRHWNNTKVISSFLSRIMVTCAFFRNFFIHAWICFELFLHSLDDFVQDGRLDFFDVLFEMVVNHLIQLSEGLAQLGVKVVLYTIVCPELG